MRAACLALTLLLSACQAPSLLAPGVSLVGSWEIDEPHGFLGGFSGLEVSDDGDSFLVLSDSGYLIRGRLHRVDGRIAGMRRWKLLPIETPPELLDDPRGLDTEGLAALGDEIFISLERINAVWRIDLETGAHDPLPRPEAFAALPENSSLEALAVDDVGRLYVVPEEADGGLYPVYRFADGAWSRFAGVAALGDFRPVGADIGPDGRLYLLERAFRLVGFASRVRRFDLTPGGLSGETVLLQTGLRRHDNLEGIAVWREADGAMRLTIVSDNNFFSLQVSEFVEYSVAP